MWRVLIPAALSALALEDVSFEEDMDALQLLQVAAKKHNNTDADFSKGDGICGLAGDVHVKTGYTPSGRLPDAQASGLFTMANSKDGRFRAQVFQCPAWLVPTIGWLNAAAFEIDGTKISILPPIHDEMILNGPVYVRAADIEYSSDQFPLTVPGTNIEFRAHKPPYSFHIVTDGFTATVTMPQHPVIRNNVNGNRYCHVDVTMKLEPGNVPDAGENGLCTKGPAATPLVDSSLDADWSLSLFTEADHHRICDYCEAYNSRDGVADGFRGAAASNRIKWAKEIQEIWKCSRPPVAPPAPPAKEQCEQNDCSWVEAQQRCSSLQDDDVLYGDCLQDFCVECDEGAAEDFVEEEEDEHPKPICVAGAPECTPDAVCTTAVKMNTLTVTQNNLGGVGPDAGAEEIRYSNAAVVKGRAVDLVVTTDSDFKTNKASRNGNAGPFGIVNVKCGTSVTVTMKVVDSENGQPVTLDTVAVTWYDLDEGKKGKGRASVTTCGSTGAIISENTELTVKRQGQCSTSTSSVAGTGKDNPTSPKTLDAVQIARAVTLPFKGVSEWTSTLSLAKGHKGRNFLFAIEPSVACGLSN